MTYDNICTTCGKTWKSEMPDETCPKCGEFNDTNIETYPAEENEL